MKKIEEYDDEKGKQITETCKEMIVFDVNAALTNGRVRIFGDDSLHMPFAFPNSHGTCQWWRLRIRYFKVEKCPNSCRLQSLLLALFMVALAGTSVDIAVNNPQITTLGSFERHYFLDDAFPMLFAPSLT